MSNKKNINNIASFLSWCNTPMYRTTGELGFELRVQAQYPEYNTYLIINEHGESILPKGIYLSASQLYEFYLKIVKND